MSKFNPFDPANGYSEEDRVALETKCASLINRAYRNPFPGASLRHDGADNAGIFFAKQLAHIKTKAYDKEFPELSGLKLFPQTSDTDEVQATPSTTPMSLSASLLSSRTTLRICRVLT